MTATERQAAMVGDLLTKRVVAPGLALELADLMESPSVRPNDSRLRDAISRLLAAPRQMGTARPASERPSPLTDLELAKYALPVAALGPYAQKAFAGNDHAFFEIREYRGTRYLRRLHGAPGDFTRSKVGAGVVRELTDALRAEGCLVATQLFGQLHRCCGVCGAQLTDLRSRELQLGPDCRQRFGL